MAKKSKAKASSGPPEIKNNKARHDYHLLERFEAGIKLTGTEVKSIRMGKAQISEAFCRVDKAGNVWLHNAYIQEYTFGTDANHSPTRIRLLLLHKKEQRKIKQEIEAGGKALIPLRLYFKQALIKCEIAIAQAKKLYDKREDVKRKTEMREAQRDMARR
ncbi:MAG: SsrA-binding protein SmpB [Opitutales bacterium]